jgi:hypothetical protein
MERGRETKMLIGYARVPPQTRACIYKRMRSKRRGVRRSIYEDTASGGKVCQTGEKFETPETQTFFEVAGFR